MGVKLLQVISTFYFENSYLRELLFDFILLGLKI